MATTKTATKSNRPSDKGLEVTAKVNRSYWRGQIEFGPKPKFVAFADISEDQEAEIRDDTGPDGMLFVVEAERPAESDASGEKPAS